METGTQILIERMKTHPEEFQEGGRSKWARVIGMAENCLPDEDKDALHDAYARVKIDRFNEEVLKTLAGELDVEETIKFKAKERYATGFTDPRGLFGGAIAKGEGQAVVLDDHINAHRALTVGANGTSSVDLMPSAFGAVPRSLDE